MIFIDRLHRYRCDAMWLHISSLYRPGHFNCSPGFDINKFKWLKALNTEVAEEYNSVLKRIQ